MIEKLLQQDRQKRMKTNCLHLVFVSFTQNNIQCFSESEGSNTENTETVRK